MLYKCEIDVNMKNNSYHLYRHYDKKGILLYAGMSADTLRRFMNHKAYSRWFKEVVMIKIQWFSTKAKAKKAETIAIKKENPLFNIKGKSIEI